jgi:hypothetical protein
MGSGQPPSRRYPPVDQLESVLQELSRLNNLSVQQLLSMEGPGSTGVSPDEVHTNCCLIRCLPVQPPGGHTNLEWFFGHDRDGYVLVTARTEATKSVWPQDSQGCALPVRLHRWMLQVPQGSETLHSCDHTRCIRRTHLSIGTHSKNLGDAWARGRRKRRLTPDPNKVIQTPRLEPAPALPALNGKTAKRESIFVLAGFSSPSKAARAQLRMQHARQLETPAGQLYFEVSLHIVPRRLARSVPIQ